MIPAVSVVMAVFNGARFLPETLASLQAQDMGDFEIVIVDDGNSHHLIRQVGRLSGIGRLGWTFALIHCSPLVA